jgi:UDP-N-acetylmuramoylalanine--D-glutamate ligase
MEEYIEAKKNIFHHQTKDARLVLNYDNEITRSFADGAKAGVIFFSSLNTAGLGVYLKDGTIYIDNDLQEILKADQIVIPGAHNIENYMAAIAAIWGITGLDSIKETASSFTGVEHRIEFVREIDGIRFYNDSIATTPSRAKAALNSFDKKLILIAGGYDKKIPFDQFGHIVAEKVKKLLLIGVTTEKIEKAVIDACNIKGITIDIVKLDTLESAVNEAYNGAEYGDVVLLSPACASFDMFKSFDERGKKYKEIVKGL